MPMVRTVRVAAICAGLLALTALVSKTAEAKPEFAKKEGVNCLYCHVAPGQARNFRGIYYRKHDHSFAEFDNVFEAKAAGVAPDTKGPDAVPANPDYPNVKVPAALNFTLKDIDGKPVKLARYEGSVILAVNVASKCGNTPQYASLEKIYEKYKGKGLIILGFPANDFGKQEPGTEKEIKDFCKSTYDVKFPLFSKVVVKGEGQTPFYKFLTSKETDPKFGGDIEWNFAKFIINRKGEVVSRIKAGTDPMKPDVIEQIEKELATEAEPK